jgi:hypothetical protein
MVLSVPGGKAIIFGVVRRYAGEHTLSIEKLPIEARQEFLSTGRDGFGKKKKKESLFFLFSLFAATKQYHHRMIVVIWLSHLHEEYEGEMGKV